MKKNIKNILLYILIFVLYTAFPYLVDYFLKILNIDINSLSKFLIYVFIYSLEFIPAIFFVILYRKELIIKFKDFKENIMDYAEKYLKYWLLGIVLMSLSSTIVSIFTKTDISNNEEAIRSIAASLPIYIAITTCITAPITEELAYRKTIKNIFINKKLCIIASGLIFGLAHVIGTYTGPLDLLYVFPYGILGSIFMYVYYDSDNIWTTMSMHFIHNTVLIIAYFVRGVM